MAALKSEVANACAVLHQSHPRAAPSPCFAWCAPGGGLMTAVPRHMTREKHMQGVRGCTSAKVADAKSAGERRSGRGGESPRHRPGRLTRRGMLLLGGLLLVGSGRNLAPSVASDGVTQRLYVGAGCFWHVQHQMVLAEKRLLGRNNRTYTAVAGYAGGKGLGAGVLDADGDGRITPKEYNAGRVCYHNRAGVADYGRLGHAEVVAVLVPWDLVPEFSRRYFDLH